MEGEWLCYRGGQFNRGRMVMLQRGSLLEGEWSCYRSSHYWREKGHVTEVESLMEGEWFWYRGGLFNGGGLVMIERWSPMEGE